MGWYLARIWIEITQLHIRWWPNRSLDEPPRAWHAPDGTAAALSDPAPSGAQPHARLSPPTSWRTVAEDVGERLTLQDLTVVDGNGFLMCVPVTTTRRVDDGFVIQLGPKAPPFGDGPACLTMHGHPEVFTGQENRTFVRRVVPEADTSGSETVVRLLVERALADWSIAGNRARSSIDMLRKGRRLSPRLRTEAARRFQPVPRVTIP